MEWSEIDSERDVRVSLGEEEEEGGGGLGVGTGCERRERKG